MEVSAAVVDDDGLRHLFLRTLFARGIAPVSAKTSLSFLEDR